MKNETQDKIITAKKRYEKIYSLFACNYLPHSIPVDNLQQLKTALENAITQKDLALLHTKETLLNYAKEIDGAFKMQVRQLRQECNNVQHFTPTYMMRDQDCNEATDSNQLIMKACQACFRAIKRVTLKETPTYVIATDNTTNINSLFERIKKFTIDFSTSISLLTDRRPVCCILTAIEMKLETATTGHYYP